MDFVLSEKDSTAPSLAEAAESGLLPSWDACRDFIATLTDPTAELSSPTPATA